jgi:hypothetical protein
MAALLDRRSERDLPAEPGTDKDELEPEPPQAA